jgi:hypothetical protein
MNKFLLVLILIVSTQLSANTIQDCTPKIIKARMSVLNMLAGKIDKAQQDLIIDSCEQAKSCLNELKAPAGKDVKLAEIKMIWTEYTATIDKDIVPKILAKKIPEAKKLEDGVQNERIENLKKLMKVVGE